MDDLGIKNIGVTHFQMKQPPAPPGKVGGTEKAEEVAEKFEAFFIGQMLQPMFASIEPAKPFGGGHAEKIWKSLMVDEVGKSMAKNGGIGLAQMIQKELLRMQEVN